MTQESDIDSLYEAARTWRAIKTIMQLLLMLPVVLVIIIVSVILNMLGYAKRVKNERDGDKKVVLVSGAKMAKSLYLIRWLGEAGHEVILFETRKYWCSGSRFSRHVKAFYTVSDPSDDEGKKYRTEILEIAERHRIDWFIPCCSPASENIDSFVADDLRSKLNAKVLHLASKYLDTF